MYTKAEEVFSTLPAETSADFLPLIRDQFLRSRKTIVVLDDDPTGTQTCYDVVVLTSWEKSLVVAELLKNPAILFILTNSRSLGRPDAVKLAQEIGANLLEAQKESGREIVIISRSDSTLRGHFPAEVDAIASALNMQDAVRILIPAFIEGGRFTINDVHYIRERDQLIPVADTPFAKDAVFGYKNSNLKEWVAEKTNGEVAARNVVSITLEDIRKGGVPGVVTKLNTCAAGGVCIVNACSHKDLEVIVSGLLEAEQSGQRFVYRTSATFVPLRAGLPAGRLLDKIDTIASVNGSLTIVGSYVPKTTRQLENLLQDKIHFAIAIEIIVSRILQDDEVDIYRRDIVMRIDKEIAQGRDVVIFTSRDLAKGENAAANLRINSAVSSFLVSIVKDLITRPAFIIAKGGITSSDIATKGLGAKKALVLGQVIPGVPVWKLDESSKYPGLVYTVFPGNVGDDHAMVAVNRKLKTQR